MDQPQKQTEAERQLAAHNARLEHEQMLDFMVGQKMDEVAKSNYTILLKSTMMPMKDPGMNKPFMTKNKKHADWVKDQATKAGYVCEVFLVSEAVPLMMNAIGKLLGKN